MDSGSREENASNKKLAADAHQAASRSFILGMECDRTAIGSGRLGLVAEPLINKAAGCPRLRAVRVGLHRLVEVGGGFLGLVEREVTRRTAQQWVGPLRCQAIGRGEILDRLLVLLLTLIDQAAAVEGLRVVGIERDRAIEFRERFFGLAGFGENLAARGVALCVADAACADIIGRFLRDRLRLSLSDPHDPRSNEQPPSGIASVIASKTIGAAAWRR